MTTEKQFTINLPTIHRQEESLSPSGCYLILSDDNTHWSKTTKPYETIEEAYAEARLFRFPADAEIRDFNGVWPY